MNFSQQVVEWLRDEGYTHCFFVAGGNIMHLLNSARDAFNCVPFIHEVSAGIAAEYFTASKIGSGEKAFALVTAGPGLTNLITAISGAWLESRELLIIGGQVKTEDTKNERMRQRGIQEIDGVPLVQSITKSAVSLRTPMSEADFKLLLRQGSSQRKGPVFLELPLDVQAATPVTPAARTSPKVVEQEAAVPAGQLEAVKTTLLGAERPVLLLGGGLDRTMRPEILRSVEKLGIPVFTTWNGADLISSDHDLYWGRPNTWGQRSSNILIQQSDLVLALGTRLGLQQTGFAWEEFCPLATVVQVDIDEHELSKGHPEVDIKIIADALAFLSGLAAALHGPLQIAPWLAFGKEVRSLLPLSESENQTSPDHINPYDLISCLSDALPDRSHFIPASSGGAFTVSMQAFKQKSNQVIISNKGLASMGYGTAGAIGAALSNPNELTVLVEGDGGFAQNSQELGTISAQNLNLKLFIYSNEGYASIRMTQRNYFNGAWIGCDRQTGLGLPNLQLLSNAYGLAYKKLEAGPSSLANQLSECLIFPGPLLIEVPIDPDQTYYPKISSRIDSEGGMRSNPLHDMDPPVSSDLAKIVFKYIRNVTRGQIEQD